MSVQTKFERRGDVDAKGREVIIERTEIVKDGSEIGWAVAFVLLILVITMGYIVLTYQQTMEQTLKRVEKVYGLNTVVPAPEASEPFLPAEPQPGAIETEPESQTGPDEFGISEPEGMLPEKSAPETNQAPDRNASSDRLGTRN